MERTFALTFTYAGRHFLTQIDAWDAARRDGNPTNMVKATYTDVNPN